jgi:hypothetical protein
MLGVDNSWSIISSNPWIGFGIFIAATLGLVTLFAGRDWLEAVFGMFRVFFTIFTTPFVFLRDALTVIRNSSEAEQDYAQTRVFTLFRYSRIQYLFIFLGALIILSAGATSGALSLWPRYELAQRQALLEQIVEIESQIEATNQSLGAAAAPDFRANLERVRQEALTAYQTQAQRNSALPENPAFQRDIVYNLMNARGLDMVRQLRERVPDYTSNCPNNYNWRGFSAPMCQQFRSYVADLANRKENEINLAQAFREADAALDNAQSVQREASARLASLQSSLEATVVQRNAIAVFNVEWLWQRLQSLFWLLLGTTLSVVVFVWLFAMAADFLNWLILLMRSAEKNSSEILARADAEYRT